MERFVHVETHSGVEQRPDHGRAALSHGKEQCVESRVERDIGGRTRLDERPNYIRVPLGGGPHQCSLRIPLGGVGVGPCVQQRPDRFDHPGSRGRHQDGFPASQCGVGIRTRVQQQPDQPGGSAGTGQRQGRDSVSIAGVDIGSGVDKLPCHALVRVVGRPMQRCGAVRLGVVGVASCVQQRTDAHRVQRLRRVCETAPGCGRGEADRQLREKTRDSYPVGHSHCGSLLASGALATCHTGTVEKSSLILPLLSPNESR